MSITEKNVLIEVQNDAGDIERQFPITKTSNIIGLKEAIRQVGSVKQFAALKLLASNPYIIDDRTKKTYRIGISDGEIYCVEVDYGIEQILNQTDEGDSGGEPGEETPLTTADLALILLLQQEVESLKKRVPIFTYDAENGGLIITTGKSSESGDGSGSGTSPAIPIASATRLGGVKIGNGIDVEEDGTISTSSGSGGTGSVSEDLTGARAATPEEINTVVNDIGSTL